MRFKSTNDWEFLFSLPIKSSSIFIFKNLEGMLSISLIFIFPSIFAIIYTFKISFVISILVFAVHFITFTILGTLTVVLIQRKVKNTRLSMLMIISTFLLALIFLFVHFSLSEGLLGKLNLLAPDGFLSNIFINKISAGIMLNYTQKEFISAFANLALIIIISFVIILAVIKLMDRCLLKENRIEEKAKSRQVSIKEKTYSDWRRVNNKFFSFLPRQFKAVLVNEFKHNDKKVLISIVPVLLIIFIASKYYISTNISKEVTIREIFASMSLIITALLSCLNIATSIIGKDKSAIFFWRAMPVKTIELVFYKIIYSLIISLTTCILIWIYAILFFGININLLIVLYVSFFSAFTGVGIGYSFPNFDQSVENMGVKMSGLLAALLIFNVISAFIMLNIVSSFKIKPFYIWCLNIGITGIISIVISTILLIGVSKYKRIE